MDRRDFVKTGLAGAAVGLKSSSLVRSLQTLESMQHVFARHGCPWSRLSLPKTQSMAQFLLWAECRLFSRTECNPVGQSSRSPALMMKTTDMRNCHDVSLFWRFN
jgi:hypothetical protein